MQHLIRVDTVCHTSCSILDTSAYTCIDWFKFWDKYGKKIRHLNTWGKYSISYLTYLFFKTGDGNVIKLIHMLRIMTDYFACKKVTCVCVVKVTVAGSNFHNLCLSLSLVSLK